MALPNTVPGDLTVGGNLSVRSMSPIANSVNDASVQAGSKVNASKLQAGVRKGYFKPRTTVAATDTQMIYRVYGATAAVQSFVAGISGTAAVGAATVTFDLKKNNVSILTGVVTIDNTVAQYGSVAGVLAAGALTLVAGDVLEVVVTATAGGGTLPQGVFAEVVIYEDPS